MEIIIQNVERWKGYVPENNNPDKKMSYSHRITTTNGHQYITWRYEDAEELKSYSKYNVTEKGIKDFSFFNEPKRQYTSIIVNEEIPMQRDKQVITDTPTLFDRESPVELTKTTVVDNGDGVYHKLALEYLWRVDKLDLVSLNKLAPHMKSICEGKIDTNKLGKLNLEFYNDRI
jgi:hypothetical protein